MVRKMPRPAPIDDLAEIENIAQRHPEGLSIREIEGALAAVVPRRTLQYRLKQLVDEGRLIHGRAGPIRRRHWDNGAPGRRGATAR